MHKIDHQKKQMISRTLKSWKSHASYWLSLAIIIGLLSGLLLIAQAWLLSHIINAVVFQSADLASQLPWLLSMLAIFLIRAILGWATEQAGFHAAIRVKLSLRKQLYRHIQQLGTAWLSHERSGDISNALSDGIEALEAYYAKYLPAVSLAALIPLSMLIFIFPADWISALMMLATAPLIIIFMIFIGHGTEKRNQKQWRQLAYLSSHFLDVIQGLTTLKLFNASRREAQAVANISNDYRIATMSVLRIAFLSSLALEFFASISIALVAVIIGFRLFYGEMDFHYGFFILLLAPEFYFPLRNMGTQYHARLDAIGAAERIIEILKMPLANTSTTQTTIPSLADNHIYFENVSFRYPDGRTALENINLKIPAKQTLAIIGASGSGKTSLINLLMGFISPSSGCIKIDDTPLNTIELKSWRQQLAWQAQQPRIFPATVADNIRLGQPQISLNKVKIAAQQAYADQFIEQLPKGYDTLIGEGGHGLSGGQIQRIALARAFLKDAPLVILDEATANLDQHSEQLIQQAIQQLCKNRTVIMITHRLYTIEQADCIAVLDKGKLMATGTHESLLAHCKHYQAMLQNKQHEENQS